MNSSFILLAQEAADQAAQGNPLGNSWIMFLVIIVLFWVLLIRPQRKAQKEQQARMNALKKGDKVVTTAGIHGTVVYVGDTTVNVEVADGITMKFEKPAIAHVQKKDKVDSQPAS